MITIALDDTGKTLLIGVLLTLLGVGYLAWTVYARRASFSQWTTTNGQITAVKYDPHTAVDSLTQTIEFTYMVQGNTYQAKEANAVFPMGILEQRLWANRYEPGHSITVFYDTRNPARVTLERGNTGAINSGLVIWLSLGLAGLAWLVFFSRFA